MEHSDVVFVCVGTPSGPDGHPEMDAMVSVTRSLAANLHHPHVFVTKSTVPIGTGNWLGSMIEDLVGSGPRLELFSVVSNPEFLREGSAVRDFLHPDRVVLGSDDKRALDIVAEVYAPIVQQQLPGQAGTGEPIPLLKTGLATAEMTKYAANAFLATKISFANEIARICDFVGADVTEVTTGIGLDSRIGKQFLSAGLGWGGSCFGKDLSALVSTAGDYGYRPELLEATISVNVRQRQLIVEQLLGQLKTLRGARIALLGLAFKPDTDDLRDAPALDLAARLIERGAFVTAYDPMVPSVPAIPELRLAESAITAATSADAVIIATEWTEFVGIDLVQLRQVTNGSLFIDARNAFDPQAVSEAGFHYVGIGRNVVAAQPVAGPRPTLSE
jgi:UDPglucose 6-dehydrogenase